MKKFTCIMCPVGCELTVIQNGDIIEVSGNGCIRGKRYAETEIISPQRMITSLVKTKNGICAVKTTNLVPKDKIFDVLNEITKLKPSKVKVGQVLIKNVLNLEGVDIIVTRE